MALVLVLASLATTEAGVFPVADEVLVEKAQRKLHLIQDGEVIRSFDIALGIRPVGDKRQEGDFRTPEGRYRLDVRNPESEFFLSIMIHGQPNEPTQSEVYYRTQDWTNGCIAVSNSDMIDLWLMTGENTPIEIRP